MPDRTAEPACGSPSRRGAVEVVGMLLGAAVPDDRIFPSPMTTDRAFVIVDGRLSHPSVAVPSTRVSQGDETRSALAPAQPSTLAPPGGS